MYAEINSNKRNKQFGNNEETPSYSKYQDMYGADDVADDYYHGGASTLAIKGLQMENTPVSLLFFSKENIKRIQREIKREVFRESNGSFKLDVDQDEMDLLLVMRAIFLDNGKNLPTHVVKQVKQLNRLTLNHIIPDMITNIKQQYDYVKEINSPINPIPLPLNVSNAGRRTLPSTTSTWQI